MTAFEDGFFGLASDRGTDTETDLNESTGLYN